MIRRVLVTGATGLVGRELLPGLVRAGLEVVPLSRLPAPLAAHVRCDLTDPAPTRDLLASLQPDAVVHLAGGAHPDRHELYRANVLTTVHLLEAAASLARAPYCVVLGSAAEYGAAPGPVPETAPLQPVTDYGRAKLAQTTLAEGIARARGLPLTILRPFNLVSHRMPEASAIGNLRRQLLATRGTPREVRCGRLDVVRDFVPVSAVGDAVLRLLRSPVPGRAINVCSGVAIDLRSILFAMARQLGVELEVVVDSALAELPAASAVVGDPGTARQLLGLDTRMTPESIAEIALGRDQDRV